MVVTPPLTHFISRYIQQRVRTRAGRPICFLCIDTTHVSVDQSEDAYAQMQTYSGKRGELKIYVIVALILSNFRERSLRAF